MTLLEEALKIKDKRVETVITEEHMELAVAYVKGEINLTQVSRSMGDSKRHSQAYIVITRALREGYRKGLIAVN